MAAGPPPPPRLAAALAAVSRVLPEFRGVRLALRSIRRNGLRSVLTVLGILIGVAAVAIVMALGTGAREHVTAQIESLGSNFIVVFPQNSNVSGARGKQGAGVRLTEEDGRAILRESVSVALMAPVLRSQTQIVFEGRNTSTSAIGSTLPFFVVRSWTVARGEAWTTRDEASKAKVCVLGATVKTRLFGDEDAIGRTVRIGRYPFVVTGVLAAKGEAPFGGDQDDIVLMPISSLRSRVLKTPPGFAGALMLSSTTAETTDRAMEQITSVLRQRHRVPEGREPDFAIRSQKEFQEMQSAIYGILTLLLVGIAGISFVVGGIGVMNIMLVSVTERTREIGTRMAIGAREKDIRDQFLVEAIVLSIIGGVVGVAFGAGVVRLIGMVLGWPMAVSPLSIVVGVGTSAVTGIAFGFFPARRAAKLDPIEALRHE